MIARIKGKLIALDSEANTILLETGDLAYELFIPGYAASDLSTRMNQMITLYCLQYHEGVSNGSDFIPRLIGFPQPQDKQFFNRFISVKGIGIRKALRAMAKPLADIAHSIEAGDAKMLSTLPEIGKRTAEQIIVELKGKMTDFALQSSSRAAVATRPFTQIEREALEILLQLGEPQPLAEDLITRALASNPELKSTDELVQTVYRMKMGTM